MEHVDAIRDLGKINAMKKLLKEQSPRDYLLFVLGINTGLKISELLSLKLIDIIHDNGATKTFLDTELFHKDSIPIFLNTKVKKAVSYYLSSTKTPQQQDYLFKSSKTNEPITRQQAYRVIHHAARSVGIEGKVGTNSMRKTYGYHAYKKGVAVSLLQKLFGHATPSETLKYLGIKNEEIITEIDVNL
jgi:site-specific recombinase XerD